MVIHSFYFASRSGSATMDVPEPLPGRLSRSGEEKVAFVSGDIHGDLDLFEKVLAATGCVQTKHGKWTKHGTRKTTLAFLGDIVDGSRGRHTAGGGEEECQILRRLIQIYGESRACGDRVIWVCGNHDIGIPSLADNVSCEKYGPRNRDGKPDCSSDRFALIRSAILKTNAKLFATIHDESVVLVHGGLTWEFFNSMTNTHKHQPSDWNDVFRRWVGSPDQDLTDLFCDKSGPFWTRPTDVSGRMETLQVAKQITNKEDTVVLLGHTVHDDPVCYRQGQAGVCFLDTGMSRAFGNSATKGVTRISSPGRHIAYVPL